MTETVDSILEDMEFFDEPKRVDHYVAVAQRYVNGKLQYLRDGYTNHRARNPFTNYLMWKH